MTKTGQEIVNYYWISRKTPTKNVKMDIVESCEITATVAPSAR